MKKIEYPGLKASQIRHAHYAKKQRRKDRFYMILTFLVAIIMGLLIGQTLQEIPEVIPHDINVQAPEYLSSQLYLPDKTEIVQIESAQVTYKNLGLPSQASGEFKTYMDFRTITNKSSDQWQLQQLAETNEEGFRILDGKYMIALGSYYATKAGQEFRITLEDGSSFMAITGDLKQDIHTDPNNQFIPRNGNIAEFIVDTKILKSLSKRLGDVSSSGFEGRIIKIEEVIK